VPVSASQLLPATGILTLPGLSIERLAADVDDADVEMLFTSVATALAEPPALGTPGHVERLALAALRELKE
jgi:hypothetical protein